MLASLQYPLERSRGLKQKWAQLLKAGAIGETANGPYEPTPPRDPDEDEDDEGEDDLELDHEPAAVREPDQDEEACSRQSCT
jgi:hypothetical protein